MIKGDFKKSAESIEIQKNCAVFVFSGALFVNGEKIESGKGILFGETSKNNFDAEDLTCLCLTYIGGDCSKLFYEAGIEQNNTFDFTISNELLSLSEIFFDGEKSYDNEMLARGMTQMFFSYIVHSEDSQNLKTSASKYVELAENYINENIENHIKIDDVSSHLGLSRGYLRNIFFDHKGISPQEYMMQKRMETAMSFLKGSDLSIGEIAEKCGYSDILQFSRIFKKRIGISPSEYRKQNMSERVREAVKNDKIKNNKNDNNINKKENDIIKPVLAETEPDKRTENENNVPINESEADLTSILAAQIEKAAREAEKERIEKEKNPTPPPFWLL